MSAPDEPVAGGSTRLFRPRYLVIFAALVLGVLAGVLVARSRTASPSAPTGPSSAVGEPQVEWAAGARPAPDFALTDQAGEPISIARFKGRPVIVTFIDPLCRNLCPLEAKILERAVLQFPAAQRPEIVSVSVNRWANARKYLLQDVRKWNLDANWHWAVGPPPALAKVWRGYQIGVLDAPHTVAGVTVHNIAHTEGSYVLDREGNERALFLYPFSASDVAREVSRIAGA
jgi:cytochrome oxidase Cu insertion factor (SCO1/SenC/PrrC family)